MGKATSRLLCDVGRSTLEVRTPCSRSRSPTQTVCLPLHVDPYGAPEFDAMQSWPAARSLSSGCKGIKRSSTPQNQVPHKPKSPPDVQASAKLTTSRSIRVTGRLDRGTNLDIARKKRCTKIWALNYWSMDSRGLTRVFWLVSILRFLFPAVRWLTSVTELPRRTDGYGPSCSRGQVGLFIDSRLPQGSGKSYRSVSTVLNVHPIA